MDKQEFINKVYSEYSSRLAISEQDISEMISRGFLVCDKEYLQHYISHFDAFKKKFEKYEDTKSLLTAHQLSETLIEDTSIVVSEAELNKMAEFGLLKRGEDFREITIEADVIHKRNEDAQGIRDKMANIEANKERHIYLFSSELAEKGYDYWFQLKNILLEKLEELNYDDELSLDQDTDEETDKKDKKGKDKKKDNGSKEEIAEEDAEPVDKSKKKHITSSRSDDYYINKQREVDARRLEESRKLEEQRRQENSVPVSSSSKTQGHQTSYSDNKDYPSQSYTENASPSSTPEYNSVNIPLSDGSYITIAPATPGDGYILFNNNDTEAARVQSVLGSYNNETGKYQMMSQAGLSEVIDYIKKTSADKSVEYVPVAITLTKTDGTTQTVYNEATNEGSMGEFYKSYYKNTEIPEYSDIDKQIQYAIGAVNFNDGTHDDEFEIRTDENGNKTVHWTPPEYITSVAPSIYSDISYYAQQKYVTAFEHQDNSYSQRYQGGSQGSSYSDDSAPYVVTKEYQDKPYGSQPNDNVNSVPTSTVQMSLMESGAGSKIPESTFDTINMYRQEHNQPPLNVSSMTIQDVVSAPKAIQSEMAQAYVSAHAVTYEDLQRVDNSTVGAIFELKYAEQTNNAHTQTSPTWASAQKAKADYEAGIGNGIDPAEAEIRKNYNSMAENGYAVKSPDGYKVYNSNGQVDNSQYSQNISNEKPVSYWSENGSRQDYSPQSKTQHQPQSQSHFENKEGILNRTSHENDVSSGYMTAAVAVPVFVSFNNTDNSGKINIPIYEVKEYAATHIMSTTLKKDAEGNKEVVPFYQTFVAEKEIEAAKKWEAQRINDNFYNSKEIQKPGEHPKHTYFDVSQPASNTSSETSDHYSRSDRSKPVQTTVTPPAESSSQYQSSGLQTKNTSESFNGHRNEDKPDNSTHYANSHKPLVNNPNVSGPETITYQAGNSRDSKYRSSSPQNIYAVVPEHIREKHGDYFSAATNKSEARVVSDGTKNIKTPSPAHTSREDAVVVITQGVRNVISPVSSNDNNNSTYKYQTFDKNNNVSVHKEPERKKNVMPMPAKIKKASDIDAVSENSGSHQVYKINISKAISASGKTEEVILNGTSVRATQQRVPRVIMPSAINVVKQKSDASVNNNHNNIPRFSVYNKLPQAISVPQPQSINRSIRKEQTQNGKPVAVVSSSGQKGYIKIGTAGNNIPSSPFSSRSNIETSGYSRTGTKNNVRLNTTNVNNNIKPNMSAVFAPKTNDNRSPMPQTSITGKGNISNRNNINTVPAAHTQQQRIVGTATGVAVISSSNKKMKVVSVGRARGLDASNVTLTTASQNGLSIPKKARITKNGTFVQTANGPRRLSVHIARANKAIDNGTATKLPANIQPVAVKTITVNMVQKGLMGKKHGTVLVLNSDKTGAMRTNTGKEIVEVKFRGFASDLGRTNARASKGDRKMSMAEAFERGRSLNQLTITADGKKYYIDREWLLHNSKNINVSLTDFRIIRGNVGAIDITQKSAVEIKGLIAKAIKENALLTENPYLKRPIIKKAASPRNKTSPDSVMSRAELAKYFQKSASVMAEAEKRSKKAGRREFWSAATRMVTAAPYLDNDMAAGLAVIRNFKYNTRIIARASQKATLKQENININKKFLNSFIGDNPVSVSNLRVMGAKGAYKDGLKLDNNNNPLSRIQLRHKLRSEIQASDTLRRNGIERMSARELSKILKTGKINSSVLSDAEKATVFNVLLLKLSRSGRIEEINGVTLFNNKFDKIQLKGIDKTGKVTGTYNFNKISDIRRALREIDDLSKDPKFRATLKGRRLSQFTNKELKKLAANKNLSEADKQLVEAALLLRAFKNEKEKNADKLQRLQKITGKIKEGIREFGRLVNGTVTGEGYQMVAAHVHRIASITKLLMTSVATLKQKRINRVMKKYRKYSKEKGLRGRLNKTKHSMRKQARLQKRMDKISDKQDKKQAKKDKKQEKKDARRQKVANKMKGVRTRAATKVKVKFNNSAIGKKFAKLKNSKFGKFAGKAGTGALRTFRFAKGVGRTAIGVPLKGIAVLQKIANFKDFIMQLFKKAAIVSVIAAVALSFACTCLSIAYDSVTGFLYNNSGSEIVEKIKAGEITSLFADEDGDGTEYASISAHDTLINDRIQYCIGMDSALKEYIEGFYTNDDIIDSVTDANDELLKNEEKLWFNPVNSKTFKDSLKENKKLGTKIKGLDTGLHYTYYDADGNTISMRSNAKDIVSVANTWIGTDLSAKGAYKTYVEKLWAYSHFVGYSLRESYKGNFIYSCNSHDKSAECYNNVALYYCNKKTNGSNSGGSDSLSKKLYDAVNDKNGSTIHNGNDVQFYFNDATKKVNGATSATSINKTIGIGTSAGHDTDIKKRMENIADINNSYKAQTAGFVTGGAFKYVNGAKEIIQMSYKDSSGAAKTRTVLQRNPCVTDYDNIEKGSWTWIENEHGCTRHEPSFHLSGSNDVTSKVLKNGASKVEGLIKKDNSVTLYPERTKTTTKFYSSKISGCTNYDTIKCAQQLTNKTVDGGTYTVYTPTTVYYCKGHLNGCREDAISTTQVKINGCKTHTTPNTSIGKEDSISHQNGVTIHHMITKKYNTAAAAQNAVTTLKNNTKGFTNAYQDSNSRTGNDSSLASSSRDIIKFIKTKDTSTTIAQTTIYPSVDKEVLDAWAEFMLGIARLDAAANGSSAVYKLSELKRTSSQQWWNDTFYGTQDKVYDYGYYYEIQEVSYVAYYDVFCLGHQTTETVDIASVYCNGYCCGHELSEFCTGHIDLDVGIVTTYADESATNNLMNLGVAKTADVTTKDDNYEAREENGNKTGKTTVLTVKSTEKDAHKYLFTGSTKMQNNLGKYIFTEWDGALSKNKFLLPKVDSKMVYEYINNYGSFVSKAGIVDGLEFVRKFVKDHDSITDNNDFDDDKKITLYDIVAKAYASFAYEKFKDENDDVSLSYGKFINMPTVAKKNNKDVHFIGFYEYVVNGDNTIASLKIRNHNYIDTGNIARVHEAMKEDWLQLYQIEFPGAYNAIVSDPEIQKVAFNIAFADYAALQKLGISVSGHSYPEFNKHHYFFMDTLYKFPETVTKTITNSKTGATETIVMKKPRGTGFLSAWDDADNMKSTNCLGKPAYYGDHSDAINFALEWGKTFLKDIGLNNGANKYQSLLNTTNFKNIYQYLSNNHITSSNIPSWITDVYQGNVTKALQRITDFKSGDKTIIKEIKSTYVRRYLMNDEGTFINGASDTWDTNAGGTNKSSAALNNILSTLKTGDLVGIGDEVYLVLYQDSALKDAKGYYENGEPKYEGETNGCGKGKVYLLTIGDVSEEASENSEDNEIHIFSYSLELLNIKRDSVWLYTPKA